MRSARRLSLRSVAGSRGLRSAAVAVLVAAGLFATPSAAQLPGEVTVGTSEGVERIPLAVSEMLGTPEASRVVRRVVLDDLAMSGDFDLVPDGPRARHRLSGLVESTPGDGADGSVEHVVTVSLEEIASGRVLTARRLRGGESSLRRIGHRIADEILEVFTGREGAFDSRIAFVSDRGAGRDVHVMDWDGNNVARVTNDEALVLSPEVSPDGDRLLFTSYVEGTPSVYLVERESGRVARLFAREGLNQSPAFEPGGERLAFSAAFDGDSEIYVSDLRGQGLRRLTHHPAIDVSPAWSPSGREIAFVSDRSGTPQVHVMDAEGLDVRRLTFEGSYNAEPAWSPDGSALAFSTRVDGRFHVAVLDVTRGEVRVLTDGRHDDEGPTWSPDGRMIAFASNRGGAYDIWVMRRDGTGLKRVGPAGENRFPFWYR